MSAEVNLTSWWNKTQAKEYSYMIHLYGKNVSGIQKHRKRISIGLDKDNKTHWPTTGC